MNDYAAIEKILREYRLNKARINFLESQINHLTPEAYTDYIESRMFSHKFTENAPKFQIYQGMEISQLNDVEETSVNYKANCISQYDRAIHNMKKEICALKYMTLIVENSLEILEKTAKKYKTFIERYYIENESMESIAESMHLSKSRCYVLCKDAVKYMYKIVNGTEN